MPALEDQFRYQKITVLQAAGFDAYGKRTVSAAKGMRARWNQRKREGYDVAGHLITIEGDLVVGQDVPIGSIVWLGDVDDYTATSGDLMVVVGFDSTPDLKARWNFRIAQLARYGEAQPTVV